MSGGRLHIFARASAVLKVSAISKSLMILNASFCTWQVFEQIAVDESSGTNMIIPYFKTDTTYLRSEEAPEGSYCALSLFEICSSFIWKRVYVCIGGVIDLA